jgi:hypothetical protein
MARVVLFLTLVFAVLYLLVALRRGGAPRTAGARAPARSRMTRAEALQVLGLGEAATKGDILRAYRELIRKVHPDTPGGSTYLASQINQAKDVLLG